MVLIKVGEKGVSHYKFSLLLLMLVLFLAVNPFFVDREHLSVRAFNALVFLVLVGNVYAATHRLRPFVVAVALAITTMASFMIADARGSQSMEVAAFLGLGLLWIYSAGSILWHIFTRRIITIDTLAGAVVVYLQIGLIWTVFYVMIETFLPGSFNFVVTALDSEQARRHEFYLFSYYSFVTLTTLGYGDLLAVSPPARAFSYLETTLAQVYLAVLVARLLGLHLSGVQGESGDRG
jgi:hypothetical protein